MKCLECICITKYGTLCVCVCVCVRARAHTHTHTHKHTRVVVVAVVVAVFYNRHVLLLKKQYGTEDTIKQQQHMPTR